MAVKLTLELRPSPPATRPRGGGAVSCSSRGSDRSPRPQGRQGLQHHLNGRAGRRREDLPPAPFPTPPSCRSSPCTNRRGRASGISIRRCRGYLRAQRSAPRPPEAAPPYRPRRVRRPSTNPLRGSPERVGPEACCGCQPERWDRARWDRSPRRSPVRAQGAFRDVPGNRPRHAKPGCPFRD